MLFLKGLYNGRSTGKPACRYSIDTSSKQQASPG